MFHNASWCKWETIEAWEARGNSIRLWGRCVISLIIGQRSLRDKNGRSFIRKPSKSRRGGRIARLGNALKNRNNLKIKLHIHRNCSLCNTHRRRWTCWYEWLCVGNRNSVLLLDSLHYDRFHLLFLFLDENKMENSLWAAVFSATRSSPRRQSFPTVFPND